MLESCLPVAVLRAWQRSPINCVNPGKNKLEQLLEFLGNEVEGDARIALARQSYKSMDVRKDKDSPGSNWKFRKPQKTSGPPTAMGLVTLDANGGSEGCIFCGRSHKSLNCFKTQRMTEQEKKSVIMSKGACFKCLNVGHMIRDCPLYSSNAARANEPSSSKPKTRTDNYQSVPPTPALQVPVFPAYAVQKKGENTTVAPEQVLSTANLVSSPDVLLPTFMVGVIGSDQKLREVRAALDTMSGHSYLTKRVLEKLKLPHKGTTLFHHAVFGGGTHKIVHKKYQILLKALTGTFSCSVNIYDQEQISSGIPGVPSIGIVEELKTYGVYIDDQCQRMKEVDLLIGGDIAGKLLTGRQIPLSLGPTAIETRFGWTVVGKVLDERGDNFLVHSMVNFHSPACMWELEAVAIQDPAQKVSKIEEEAMTMEHFSNTVSRNDDGRYQVSLPWIEDKKELPNNLKVATKRLESATRTLQHKRMVKEYESVFDEWISMGVIEEIEPNLDDSQGHYLPHRPVIKLESATTKIRPVFDASCRARTPQGSDCPSLNDCLLKGPNLMEQIPDILLRFREDKIAAIADIRKAFLMIEVKPEDRQFLRFLWWKDLESKTIKVYQHCRVVFGVNCSPFLLNAVIAHHLKNEKNEKNSACIDKLQSCLYVDNVAASFSSVAALENFKKTSCEILDRAKFDLRLWESNVDENIENKISNVLGMKWNRNNDELFCDSSLENLDLTQVTKRTILSALARVFDPLGMLAPVVLVPKLLVQKCWKEKLAWHQEVPDQIRKHFISWMEGMRIITEARVPRYIGVPTPESSVHIFCDASELGYAAVAYLRVVLNSSVELKFLMCRSRVAPMEKTTINRLELIACEIATRLGATIKEALGWHDVPFIYWTDSTIAKAWIIRDKDWGTFVGNRVRKIRAVTSAEDWRHVPGILNPADLPSRGCDLKNLMASDWWKGPAWLKEKSECWLTHEEKADDLEVDRELRKTAVTAVAVPVEEPWYSSQKCRIGTFRGIVKLVAWMHRFMFNSRARNMNRERASGPLTKNELDRAELSLFFVIQLDARLQDLKFPFRVKNVDNLLRVETKLTYREDEVGFKSPVILPGKHYLTRLLIREQHLNNNHAGVQFLMANLREKVWITRGRQAIKDVVRSCIHCKRFTVKNQQPVTAPLPPNRIRDANPFEVTGIDFAGPLYLKTGAKIWICLFTCAVFRAVHLELVNHLSTEAFLNCLRKFIARRGRPKTIYTDNGTNFVGAQRLLKQIDWKEVEKDAKASPIQWIFSPPSAPWWGGWWERLVRSMKELLVRNLGRKVLKREELDVTLCDVEATLNGRPLTYVADDDVLVPLTPALFLHGSSKEGTPDLDVVDRNFLQKRHKFRQSLMDNLRQRFRKEYLGHLLQRQKEKGAPNLKVGDVVLLGSDLQKRLMWPVGVIEEIKEGRDGIVRVAQVRTNSGTYLRPVQRLFPMEICNPEDYTTSATIQKTRSGRIVKSVVRFGQDS